MIPNGGFDWELLLPPSADAVPLHHDRILVTLRKRQQASRASKLPSKLKNLAPAQAHSVQVLRHKAPLEIVSSACQIYSTESPWKTSRESAENNNPREFDCSQLTQLTPQQQFLENFVDFL